MAKDLSDKLRIIYRSLPVKLFVVFAVVYYFVVLVLDLVPLFTSAPFHLHDVHAPIIPVAAIFYYASLKAKTEKEADSLTFLTVFLAIFSLFYL